MALGWVLMGAQSLTAQTVSALRINEVMSANVDQFIDPSWNYGGWIEVYNPTVRDMNLKTSMCIRINIQFW